MKDKKKIPLSPPAGSGEPSLASLDVGERATVLRLEAEGPMRRRFLDLGLLPGTIVSCVGKSPAGDPAAYEIKSAVIAIRAKDAGTVIVTPCPPSPSQARKED